MLEYVAVLLSRILPEVEAEGVDASIITIQDAAFRQTG